MSRRLVRLIFMLKNIEKGVINIDSFMSWIGGKKLLRNKIVSLFPEKYEYYIEVFGGAGWVLFHKEPSGIEVYNDLNGLLVNLYRCVREYPNELISQLKYTLNSKDDFYYIKEKLSENNMIKDDIKRAAYFYQLIRHSYGSKLRSYAYNSYDIWNSFPYILNASRRLSKVIIDNKDFEKVIDTYDSPNSFFYLDPPYFETEDYYQNMGKGLFEKDDHLRLFERLMKLKGKFLLSYNDCEVIRKLYEKANLYICPVTRANNLKCRYEVKSQYFEILIANYDINQISIPTQITFFNN